MIRCGVFIHGDGFGYGRYNGRFARWELDARFVDLVDGNGSFHLIAQPAAQGSESVGVHVLTSGDFGDFKEFKVLRECLNDFKVRFHSFVAGIVVATKLTGNELQVTVCTEPLCFDHLSESQSCDQ